MSDLTDRLRRYKQWIGADEGLVPVASTDTHPLMAEAADEIDRLTAALAAKDGEIERLMATIRAIDSLRGPFMSDDDVESVWRLVDAALAPPQPQGGHRE